MGSSLRFSWTDKEHWNELKSLKTIKMIYCDSFFSHENENSLSQTT